MSNVQEKHFDWLVQPIQSSPQSTVPSSSIARLQALHILTSKLQPHSVPIQWPRTIHNFDFSNFRIFEFFFFLKVFITRKTEKLRFIEKLLKSEKWGSTCQGQWHEHTWNRSRLVKVSDASSMLMKVEGSVDRGDDWIGCTVVNCDWESLCMKGEEIGQAKLFLVSEIWKKLKNSMK
jgi:hypothetical protein